MRGSAVGRAEEAGRGPHAKLRLVRDRVIDRILEWAEREEAVRVVAITSTRARDEGPPDALSDYDVVLALTDVDRFDPAAAYATPAARWSDESEVHGAKTFFRGVVYEDGTKIDWTLW